MDTKSNINNGIQYINDSSLRSIFTNPLYLSLVTSFIIIIIVIMIYAPNRIIKTTFYITLINIAFIFIHNKLLLMDCRKEQISNDMSNITNIIDAGPTHTVKSSFGGSDILKHISL